MRIRSLGSALLALTLVACSESTTSPAPAQPQAQVVQAAAPLALSLTATSTLSPASLNDEINGLIDQLFNSPVIRSYVHNSWNWAVAQLAQCPPSAAVLRIEAYLDKLVAVMQGATPKGNAAKTALLTQLVTDMSAYVNQAIAACPAS